MKKLFAIILALLIMGVCLTGCGNNQSSMEPLKEESVEESAQDSESNLKDLNQGDLVTIVGQVAGTTLVNGDTLWVQVKQSNGSFVVYHCQLKHEFIKKAETLDILSIVKVKGSFLSFSEFEQENTADIATLYDCEIVE